jgi:predicted phage baseplate assembly protein
MSDEEAAGQDDTSFSWYAQSDLLDSGSDDRHFVAEIDNNGQAHLRFGNGELGRSPDALAEFEASYRTGNGTSGNVGAEAIRYLVIRQGVLDGIEIHPRNPMSAQGGTEPESMAEVKMFAPGAIRKDLQRAITADDYARLAERNNKVQRAAAEILWAGSWYEARVSIDQRGTDEFEGSLQQEIEKSLYRYRRMGQDISINPADYVPLEIELLICVSPHYQRGHVQAALLDAFSNRQLPDGQRGFFHPDNLTFGEGIYLSKLVATAQAIDGVQSVTVKKLQQRFAEAEDEIASGVLPLDAMQIAQLDNDPNFPEHGKLTLVMHGGR